MRRQNYIVEDEYPVYAEAVVEYLKEVLHVDKLILLLRAISNPAPEDSPCDCCGRSFSEPEGAHRTRVKWLKIRKRGRCLIASWECSSCAGLDDEDAKMEVYDRYRLEEQIQNNEINQEQKQGSESDWS